jgi:hypothetical protein
VRTREDEEVELIRAEWEKDMEEDGSESDEERWSAS